MGDDDVDVIMMRTMGMRVWMMGGRGEMRGGTFSYVETGKHENVVSGTSRLDEVCGSFGTLSAIFWFSLEHNFKRRALMEVE